jgi:hypothetical protein
MLNQHFQIATTKINTQPQKVIEQISQSSETNQELNVDVISPVEIKQSKLNRITLKDLTATLMDIEPHPNIEKTKNTDTNNIDSESNMLNSNLNESP